MRRSLLFAVLLLTAAGCGGAAAPTTTSAWSAPTAFPVTTSTAAAAATTTTTTTTTTLPPTTATTRSAVATTEPVPCAELGTGDAELALFGTPSGTRRWATELGEPLAAFTLAGTTVLVVSGGSLVAVDGGDCQERWRTGVDDRVSIAAAGGVAYIAAPELVSARDVASGAPLWSAPVDPMSPGVRPRITDGELLVVAEGAAILGFDAVTGDLDYEIELPGAGAVAAGNGLLFATGAAAELGAYELATGFAAWSAPLAAPGVALTWDGGGVFVALEDGSVAALDAADGDLRWNVSIGDQPLGPPMVDHNEVHQLDEGGRLHHLKRGTGESVFVGTFDPTVLPVPDARLVVEQGDGTVTASNLLERVVWTIAPGRAGFTEVRVGEGFVVAHTLAAG